jgi:hypothetical protein
MNSKELQSAFQKKLKESGLTKADAEKLGFRPYAEEEAAAKFPDFPPRLLRAGFVLPYRDLNGKLNGFLRWRNLDRSLRGFAALGTVGEDGKRPEPPPKYLQASGSCAELFLPFPNVACDWKKIAADVDTPLLTTEGELKACCAVKHGLPTFAIGGADMFTSKKNNLWLLKSFDWFEWGGREVYVILDSDASTNPNVRDAGRRYCSRLSSRGAHIYQLTLPALSGLEKTGLDDYLEHKAEGGKERLLELMRKTKQWPQSAELWAMNDVSIYVRQVSQVYIPGEDVFLKPGDFVSNYRPRTYTVTSGSGDKLKMERKVVPSEWLGWDCRRECARVTFDPASPPLEINSADEFNMFPGLDLEPKEGDLAPWTELMDWMFAKEEHALRNWFLSWAAYPLQCIKAAEEPKMHSCVALISHEEGTGKGLVGETIGKLYGKAYVPITSSELRSDFNDWAKNRLFVLGNEITNKASADLADQLKGMITESTFWLHPKGVKRMIQPNHMNFLFTSNHTDAFFLSFSDRRFFIHAAPEHKLLEGWGREKVDEYVAWRDSAEGRAALLYHLLERKIPSSWDHRSPPATAAKYMLQSGSANQAENWLRDVADRAELLKDLKDRRLWTAEELLDQFKQTTGNTDYGREGMGQALRKAGWYRVLRGNQIRNLKTYKQVRGEYREEPFPKRPLWAPPQFEKEVCLLSTERALAQKFNEERRQERDAKIAAKAASAKTI